MLKIILVATVCFVVFITAECTVFKAALNFKNTTHSANDRAPDGYFKVNNIPKADEGCKIKFECKKKLKHAEIPKPCVKFCVRSIECENGKKSVGAPGQCVELNEEMVTQEYNDCKKDGDSYTPEVMPVALIDFPCQPGYLPDSRGRCREVW